MTRTSTDQPLDAQALRLQAELLSLPARYLRELPVLTRIVAYHTGMNRDIVLWSGTAEGGVEGQLSFDGEELHALACGAESERLWAWDFTGFCLLKQHDARFRLTEALALAGAPSVESGPAWPLGKVLERLGLVLAGVELVERTPASGQFPALPGARAA